MDKGSIDMAVNYITRTYPQYPEVGDIWLHQPRYYIKEHFLITSEESDEKYGALYGILCLETGCQDKVFRDFMKGLWTKVA